MGNLDKSAIANPNQKIYEQLLTNGADILSTDELILAVLNLITIETIKNLNLLT